MIVAGKRGLEAGDDDSSHGDRAKEGDGFHEDEVSFENEGDSENSVVSVEGNNETIETNERRGPLPFFRELSSLSLFLELHS